MVKKNEISFIDLFAGIGGFRIAMEKFNSKCVFSSEIDKHACKVYNNNFREYPQGDITKISEKDIPEFDMICGGFPCQSFSKGGYQNGFNDTRGTLFFDICRIIDYHKPKYVLLENVSNLVTHDNGNTFEVIKSKLKELGYILPKESLIISPHYFNIPVLRPRVYIPAIRKDLTNEKELDFSSLMNKSDYNNSIYSIIDEGKKEEKFYISEYEEKILNMWNDFYKGIDLNVIGFPIWSQEFGKNYDTSYLPNWKQTIIQKNRSLYERNKKFIDTWLEKYSHLSWCKSTHTKFEWQAGDNYSDIFECLIQFRPSGIRVKRPDKFSTLVAMNHPQIIGKYERRLTPNETKRLQSFPEDYVLHENDSIALKQLGNAVNVVVLEKIIKKLLSFDITVNEESRTNN